MSKKDKLADRLKGHPKDFTWAELEKLLKSLGYAESKTGKTGGSRRRFIHLEAPAISLHKPHPGTILKAYQINQILETLEREKLI
jgi:predicted RNA binding protein YcfA (HicA-like mRNA interferase family)